MGSLDDLYGEVETMIPVERVAKPSRFDRDARDPGNEWLVANPNAKAEQIPDYWSAFRPELAGGFNQLCGYSAMFARRGTVDHYICKSSKLGRTLAYEWSNYRFASHEMNAAKGTWNARILDPYEVGHDWFEILLPNLEMVIVEERIPKEWLDDAIFTLKTLGLGDDADMIAMRREWYDEFIHGRADLEFLTNRAPLIASAVRKRLSELNSAAFDDEQTWFRRFLDGHCTLKVLRDVAPHLADTIDTALARPDKRTVRTNIVRS